MKVILCDTNTSLVQSWKEAFANVPLPKDNSVTVEVHPGSIFNHDCDALVSPANSFGFMDGGFDYLLSMQLGWHVQKQLQAEITALPEKELLVGRAITIITNHPRWPYLISAPTMRVPMILTNTVNVYLAAKAVFNETKKYPFIKSIGMTGLGTGVGRVSPQVCAHQMSMAFTEVFNDSKPPISWHDAQTRHQMLCLQTPRDLQQYGI